MHPPSAYLTQRLKREQGQDFSPTYRTTMRNNYFSFKQFTVYHDLCAMKVGTDGVLLGALADGGKRILDIGTGTGLIALMMAQRYPEARITGIDIDHDAVLQAQSNVAASPFANNIDIIQADLADFITTDTFDSITCNPPFFENSALCPDEKRSMARHTTSLPFSTLISKAARLLADNGVMTLIIPTESLGRIEEECTFASLFISKRIFIRTVERKPPKRVVVCITKHRPVITSTLTHCLMQDGGRSEWYTNLCKDFYL